MSTERRYQIAQDGEVVGDFTVSEMLEQVRAGASFEDAHYLHPCGQWKPAAPLVNARIAEEEKAVKMRSRLMAKPTSTEGLTRAGVLAGLTPGGKAVAVSDRSRVLYVILALLLGGLGLHNFYAGHIARAAFQLALSVAGVFCAGIPWLVVIPWVLIEVFMERHDSAGKLLS